MYGLVALWKLDSDNGGWPSVNYSGGACTSTGSCNLESARADARTFGRATSGSSLDSGLRNVASSRSNARAKFTNAMTYGDLQQVRGCVLIHSTDAISRGHRILQQSHSTRCDLSGWGSLCASHQKFGSNIDLIV
ncbi:hypothetical protein ACOSQ2_026871 [Xanthoceras sorbifolium]